jgi:hypothetical protein
MPRLTSFRRRLGSGVPGQGESSVDIVERESSRTEVVSQPVKEFFMLLVRRISDLR